MHRFFLLLWLFIPFHLLAAERAPDSTKAGPTAQVGPMLGVVFGFATGEPTRAGTTRNAMSFGVGADVPIDHRFAFCPELHFIQRGATPQFFEVAGVNVSGTLRLNYFELPLLAKIRISNERFRTFFVVGPNLGIATNRDILVLVSADLSSRFSAFDLSFIVGYGMDYSLPGLVLTAQLRGQSSILNISTLANETFRNASVQLLTGVRF